MGNETAEEDGRRARDKEQGTTSIETSSEGRKLKKLLWPESYIQERWLWIEKGCPAASGKYLTMA
jgi:hypothetical protein